MQSARTDEESHHRPKRPRRRAPGTPGMIRAFLLEPDGLAVVASLVTPDFRCGLVDRLLVLAELEEVPVHLVLTKIDLLSDPAEGERWQKLYASLGYPTTLVSTRTGQGVEEVRAAVEGKRWALCGHSGVGKSSLARWLAPGEEFIEVGEVNALTGKGRQTTTRVRRLVLPEGGELFDLPGLRLTPVECHPRELVGAFPEFARQRCRFSDCQHLDEPGCLVCAGLESGEPGSVHPSRYASYRQILEGLDAR